jgi:hypothetical protein
MNERIRLPDTLPPFFNKHGSHNGDMYHPHLYNYSHTVNLWVCQCGRKITDESVTQYYREAVE